MYEDKEYPRNVRITVTANGYLVRPVHDVNTVFNWHEEAYIFESYKALCDFLETHMRGNKS